MAMRTLPNRSKNPCSVPMSRFGSPPQMLHSSKPEVPECVVLSSCKCDKISSLFNSFDTQKVNLLTSIGFGGLLKIPVHEKLNDDLSLWLYQRFDFHSMCLHLDGGVDLHITDPDVHLILGIPFEGRSVQFALNHSKDTISAFKHILFNDNTSPSLTLSFLEHILSKDYANGFTDVQAEAFKTASVLYSMSYLLAPELQHEFPAHLIKNFIPDVKPQDINWAQFILWTLGRGSAHAICQLNDGSKKISLFGCALLIQVFYLDNLNFGPSTPYHNLLPRASVFYPDFITELIQSDSSGISDVKLLQFGKTELRSAYDVCYTRGWQEHLNAQSELELASQDDYLNSIEILSEGLRLLHKFATQMNQLSDGNQYAAQEPIEATKSSYLNFITRTKENIHNLSTKAADLLKRRNLNLYHHHVPLNLPSTCNKRSSAGTTNISLNKRAKCFASPLGKRTLIRQALSVRGPVLPQLVPNKVISGQVWAAQTSMSKLQASSSKTNIPTQEVDEQTSSSNAQPALPNRKVVTNHSNFPISSFDLLFNHPDVERSKKTKCYEWMTGASVSPDELNCNWIVFDAPTPLSIPGHVVQHCLKQNGIFTVSIVDAIIVLWNYLDGKVYNYFQRTDQTHKRWRHFLPPSFAEVVFDHGDYLNSEAIRSSFISDHTTYNVADCQKIIVPVFGKGGTWSCYFWDFKFKTITILDPMLMHSSTSKCMIKHQHSVLELHKALLNCCYHFFPGWEIEDTVWVDVYLTDIDRRCKAPNSGLYSVHYARSFCGSRLAFNLKEPTERNLSEARGEIMYQFLACADNRGYKPIELMESIGHYMY